MEERGLDVAADDKVNVEQQGEEASEDSPEEKKGAHDLRCTNTTQISTIGDPTTQNI